MSAVGIRELAGGSVFAMDIPRQLALPDVEVYLARFATALAREEPFGAVFTWTEGRPRKDRAANRAEDAWLTEHRPLLHRWMFGLAMVTEPTFGSALPKLAIRAGGPRMFGCPCRVVDDEPAALAWLATLH